MEMTCKFNSRCILKSDLINKIVSEGKELHGIVEFCNKDKKVTVTFLHILVNNFFNVVGHSALRISRFDSF